MTTELWIENYRLDVTEDISSLLTFELDNVKDFSTRSTTWSKTVVLPGTATNNKLFGHIFQIGQSNAWDATGINVGYNFNASKSADIILFQDHLQTFKGVLRLLQINIDKGKIEYEVGLFGELALLNVSLASAFIDDLDFSAYNHVFNTTNILASWDNAGGSGYYYPLIDYGQTSVDKHSWDVRTFRPAFYVKQYIDKMFTAAGFRYSSDLFNTTRFKKLIIPNNQKLLTQLSLADLLNVFLTGNKNNVTVIDFDSITSTHFVLQDSNRKVVYTTATSVTSLLTIAMTGNFTNMDLVISFLKNGVAFLTKNFTYVGSGFPQFYSINQDVTDVFFANGDYLSINVTPVNTLPGYTQTVSQARYTAVTATPVDNPIDIGDTIAVNGTLPKNVRQIDFLVSIVKLFNLYVYEDKFDQRLIYIKPYIDFYSVSSIDSIDWTYKLNREKVIKIRPMSEINAKIYEFKFKSDSDYYNDLYRKRYGEGYGDHTFDSEFEFAETKNSLELIFSATPLVGYTGEQKVIPTIFKRNNEIEEKVDSNIRIMQSKKITGVVSWNIMDGPFTTLTSTTVYGYAGHLDDPDAPANDLNFGALSELFFVLLAGNLTVNQFNVYWSSYMAEITDKDSKLVEAWMYLTAKDILNLDFSKKIYLDGVLFRLNSIKDYNATRPSDCVCELLKIGFLIY